MVGPSDHPTPGPATVAWLINDWCCWWCCCCCCCHCVRVTYGGLSPLAVWHHPQPGNSGAIHPPTHPRVYYDAKVKLEPGAARSAHQYPPSLGQLFGGRTGGVHRLLPYFAVKTTRPRPKRLPVTTRLVWSTHLPTTTNRTRASCDLGAICPCLYRHPVQPRAHRPNQHVQLNGTGS